MDKLEGDLMLHPASLICVETTDVKFILHCGPHADTAHFDLKCAEPMKLPFLSV